MTRGAVRTWVPPQRHPGESTRHFVAILERHMRNLKLVFGDSRNGHDLRQKCRNRYDKCLALRDEALMPRETR